MTSTSSPSVAASARERLPSVLVVFVVRDAGPWLRDGLSSLAGQTYPRVAVLAVDDGSVDDSHDLLIHALGAERVLRHDLPRGLARSFAEVAALPMAASADHLLLLHGDAALDADAVTRLVDATKIPGVERVGVVGPKVVDWEHPRVLRGVGRSADRFGHPYSPLQSGELDQGQFDRVLEVLSVDSCAMLVARDVWERLGLFDERLEDDGELDLCWRARVAGWRVLMTPLARVRHLAAAERVPVDDGGRTRRFEEDRAAFAAVLKNYSLVTLLWVVPLALCLAVVRLAFFTLSRRFEEAFDLLRALWWNVTHLPGTLRRRRRVQRARRVRDGALRPFTESAGLRIPRWFQTAERILEEQRAIDEDDEDGSTTRRLRQRTASLVGAHPVIVTSFVGAVAWVVVVRHLLGPEPLAGGVLPRFPASPSGFFAELVSAYRTTGLGGPLAGSPALGAMGGLSYLLFGSTGLAQKAMLAGLPALGVILMYRAAVRHTGRAGPAVVGAVAYGVSAIMLWAYSEGRLDLLVALAVLPALAERAETAFAANEPADGRRRFAAGLAVTLAVGVAFVPALALAFGVSILVQTVAGGARLRGLGLSALALVGATILLFPFVPALWAGGGAAFASEIGTTDLGALGRLTLGPSPGSWGIAAFLPLGAILGLGLARGELRGPAVRAATVTVVALALAWLSAAGRLPASLANAPIYTSLAAVGEALLVAFGLSSVAVGLTREAFGFRQVGSALLAVVLGAGIVLQALDAMVAHQAIGGADRIPAAWAVVESEEQGSFRVLWVGADNGTPFPPPGGDPKGVVQAGDATLRFGLTGRDGVLAIDTARPLAGPGEDRLDEALSAILAGSTVHGGSLLASFGIKYIVAREGEVSSEARDMLAAQVDLDAEPASGLVILRNSAALPPAAVLAAGPEDRHIVASGDPALIQRFRPPPAVPLDEVTGGWSGSAPPGGLIAISAEFDDAWRLVGSDATPVPAFGWATSFTDGPSSIRVRYSAQLPRTLQIWLLAAIWVLALWVTRKPVAR